MIDTRTFLKIPFNFEGLCKVYPPSIEDVLSSEEFDLFHSFICISQEDIEDMYEKKEIETNHFPTPLEFLLGSCVQNKDIEEAVRKGFLFFIREPVTFLYENKKILIGEVTKVIKDLKEIKKFKALDEENYFDFQNLVRKAIGESPVERPDTSEHPKIRAMKAKARYRDRIKAKKGTSGGISFQTSLEALCCMGIGLTPLNIGQISYAAVSVLMERYQMKTKYETDISSLLAGAKSSKVHPVYWIKDIK